MVPLPGLLSFSYANVSMSRRETRFSLERLSSEIKKTETATAAIRDRAIQVECAYLRKLPSPAILGVDGVELLLVQRFPGSAAARGGQRQFFAPGWTAHIPRLRGEQPGHAAKKIVAGLRFHW